MQIQPPAPPSATETPDVLHLGSGKNFQSVLSATFLIFPATADSARDRVPITDQALFILCLGVSGYFAATGLQSLEEGWEFEWR